MIPKHLSLLGLAHGLFSRQECDVLPRHSAADLTHDVETAWPRRQIASLRTLVIQGVFDAVYPGRFRDCLFE